MKILDQMGKNKILFICVALLAASCNLFSTTPVAGMVKTVNGGTDWQFINKLKDSTTASLSALQISKLGFDPQNRQILFAGAYNGGLYQSQDAGENWSKILSKIYVYDFAVDPLNSKNIFTAGSYGGNGEVLQTIDGGVTWQEAYNEGSANSVVRSMAVNPLSTNQLVIGTQSGNVIKSIDSGKDWQLLKNFQDQINKVIWQNNTIYVLVKTKGLYKSVDGGLNFTEMTANIPKQSAGDFFTSDGGVTTFSQLAVSLSDPNVIYITTDIGLYKTTDEGKIWVKVKLPIKSQGSIAKAVAIAKTSNSLVFTSVGATIYKSIDSGVTWQTQKIATNGFINYILVDPQLSQIAYGGIYVPPSDN